MKYSNKPKQLLGSSPDLVQLHLRLHIKVEQVHLEEVIWQDVDDPGPVPDSTSLGKDESSLLHRGGVHVVGGEGRVVDQAGDLLELVLAGEVEMEGTDGGDDPEFLLTGLQH